MECIRKIKPQNKNDKVLCNMLPEGEFCDYSVFITGLPYEWSLKQMIEEVARFGPVLCFYLEGAKNTDGTFNSQFTGNAIVKFWSKESAKRAKESKYETEDHEWFAGVNTHIWNWHSDKWKFFKTFPTEASLLSTNASTRDTNKFGRPGPNRVLFATCGEMTGEFWDKHPHLTTRMTKCMVSASRPKNADTERSEAIALGRDTPRTARR